VEKKELHTGVNTGK